MPRPVTTGRDANATVRVEARRHRRRLLRQLGVKVGDLEPLGKLHLDQAARTAAKLELLDAHIARIGVVDARGENALRVYATLANTMLRHLRALQEHLPKRGQATPTDALAAEGRRVRLAAEERLRAVGE